MPELIDREATLKKMCETCGCCEKFEKAMRSTHPDFVTDKCREYKFFAEQPAVEAEPVRHGRWIPTKLKGYYECSACKYEHTSNPTQRFCSYCGAKMDGGNNNVLD